MGGADINAYRGEALINAIQSGNESTVKLLVDKGANVNVRGGDPLLYATMKGKHKIVNLLIEKGANVGLDNSFELAKAHGFRKIIKLLRDADPDLDNRN